MLCKNHHFANQHVRSFHLPAGLPIKEIQRKKIILFSVLTSSINLQEYLLVDYL
jgi:hypothetical protein